MAASTHRLTSPAGIVVLESGGTAFDAVVAAGGCLQVVPPLDRPGGDVPVLFAAGQRSGRGAGGAVVLSGQGVAPAGATIDAVEQVGLDLVPGTGLLAATVPRASGA
jgi:gamma-glutamyltranspeptidase/glutathione hydrolase